MTIIQKVAGEMRSALKSRETDRLGALRLIKSELSKAEIDTGRELNDEGAQEILVRMAKQRREASELYRQGERPELAAKEDLEQKVIESFLPEALSDEQIDRVIGEVLDAIGPVDPAKTGMAIGKVMGALKSAGGTFDGKAVSERIRQRLASS